MTAPSSCWTRVVLGDVVSDIEAGKSFAGEPRRAAADEWGIIKVSAMTYGTFRADENKAVSVGTQFSRDAEIRPGDILLSRANTREYVGASVLVGDCRPRLLLSDKSLRIKPTDSVDRRWLWYALSAPTSRRYLSDSSSGVKAGMRNISQASLRSLPLLLPPIDEQRRIVDILEDHLSRLDAAQVALGDAVRRASLNRISLLSKAFDRADWPKSPLHDLLELSVGGLWGSAPGGDQVDVRVLRVTELSRNGELNFSTAAIRSISQRQLASRRLVPGDLLLEKSGGGPNTPVGRIGLVRFLDDETICSNFMQLLRPRTEVVPRFLHLYLNAFHLRGGTRAMQTASTNIRNIKASEYVKTLVPSPDRPAQETTVARLDADIAASDRLEADVRRGVARSVSLRRALLDAAFSGRLTARGADVDLPEEMADV